MSEQIKRYTILYDARWKYESADGEFVLHSDHLAALEAARDRDKAEIERLRGERDEWAAKYWDERARDQARIAELESSVRTDNTETLRNALARIAELEAGKDEAVRRDAELEVLRLRMRSRLLESPRNQNLGIDRAAIAADGVKNDA